MNYSSHADERSHQLSVLSSIEIESQVFVLSFQRGFGQTSLAVIKSISELTKCPL